jgi:anti-sigma B factor antagonist
MSTRENAIPSPNPFQVGDQELEGIRVITVSGELDLSTAPRLEEPLDAALASGDAKVVIDLSGCEFIDSTGIALIVRAWQRLDGENETNGTGHFALCGLSDQVRRLLEVSGLESSLPIFDSCDEARAQLRG